jgi:uncharacterized damage-inducible protein DinB
MANEGATAGIAATVLKGWDRYQGLLVGAIAPLTAEQLALRSAPHLRSIGELAAHIVRARANWFQRMLHGKRAEIAEFTTLGDPDTTTPTADELARGLETTWGTIQAALDRWTPADLDEIVIDEDWRGQHYRLTRQWVMFHLLEHDMSHGGELFLTLGMHHLPAPDL